MVQPYVLWALLGMAGYSFTTLFVKLAERSGEASTFMVIAVSTSIVAVSAFSIVALRGELKPLLFELERPPLLWAIAAGIALTIAVNALFHALSLGPASVVVPIYGMFVIGGSLLGVAFLGEQMAWHKLAGLVAAVIGIILSRSDSLGLWRRLCEARPSITPREDAHGKARLQNRQT